MRMLGNRAFGRGHEQLACHSQVDDPLSIGGIGILSCLLLRRAHAGSFPGSKFENNVLARAVDGQKSRPYETPRLSLWRRLERLWIRGEPHFDDAVAAHALVHAARDGLHLRQFRHWSIVVGRAWHAASGPHRAIEDSQITRLNSHDGFGRRVPRNCRIVGEISVYCLREKLH